MSRSDYKCNEVATAGDVQVGNRDRLASGESEAEPAESYRSRAKTQPRASQVAKRASLGGARAGDAKQAPDEGTDGWCTPKWLGDALGLFGLDPCSNNRSHIRAGYRCSLDDSGTLGDGLQYDWRPEWSVFCNPPYSDVMPWARKLSEHDGPWVALLKLDPTTKWWATLMSVAPTVAPFRKRIRFESGTDGDMTANFPSVLVYSAWRPPRALAPHLWLPTYEIRTGVA